MCGLAGIFSYGRDAAPVDPPELTAIRDQMQQRGPDSAASWISDDGRVGLAHRRLSIIDLSDAGTQPMHSADGRLSIVFNGEIYNYRELRQELIEQGVDVRTGSDTEVLLHLYDQHGEGMLSRLRGMFAFAIWDAAKDGLFVARDHFGIKPLYIADDGETLRFASQVRALLAGGKVRRDLDPAGQVSFFLLGYVADPFTLYRNIEALEPGVSMWIDRSGKRRVTQYFNITSFFAGARSSEISHGDMLDRFSAAFTDTVRAHLVADVDVGLFLSAGRDSASLASAVHELDMSGFQALTVRFEEHVGSDLDESDGASDVAKQYGLVHQIINCDRITDAAGARFRDVFAAMDQPTVDGFNTYSVSEAAASRGLRVCMSGLGADELMQGYHLFGNIQRMAGLFSAFRHTPSIGRMVRRLSSGVLSRLGKPAHAGLLEYGCEDHQAYLLARCVAMPWRLHEVLPNDVVRDGLERLDLSARLRRTVEGIDHPVLRISCLELSWYLRNQLLKTSDWSSMAHSLELRVPFIDIEFLRAMLPLMATPDGLRKTHMVEALPSRLPESILNGSKRGFSIPVNDWVAQIRGTAPPRGDRQLGWAGVVYDKFVQA